MNQPQLRPFYDIDNPGSRTPAVREALQGRGVRRFHATCAPGADPKAVEREVLLALDRMEHKAYTTKFPKPSIFGWIADRGRVLRYNLFRARKAAREIDAKLAKHAQVNAGTIPTAL